MRNLGKIIKRDGIFGIFDRLVSKLKSNLIRLRFKYGKGFTLGSGTSWIVQGKAVVGSGFKAGKRCKFEVVAEYEGVQFNPQLSFGDNVTMNDDVHIGCAGTIALGNNILMASKIYISDHNHGSYGHSDMDILIPPKERKLRVESVIIEDNVWIGEMVSILPGVKIGEGAVIGANSVVTKDIPAYSIAVGVPARVIKKLRD